MRKLQDLYDYIFQRRENEKVENPTIICQIGKLGFQIYAGSPLQFNVMDGNIYDLERTKQEMDIQFIEKEVAGEKRFTVCIINPNLPLYKEKREFRLDEGIEKLAEAFPSETRVVEITKNLLTCVVDEP